MASNGVSANGGIFVGNIAFLRTQKIRRPNTLIAER